MAYLREGGNSGLIDLSSPPEPKKRYTKDTKINAEISYKHKIMQVVRYNIGRHL